jgi:predicted glycoside hydrolase/deacetylase ChbG (UPF0249 family)
MICTDDFGMNADISDGILDLCEHKKIQAVSVMTESPILKDYIPKLIPLKKIIHFGLHFNLTTPFEGEAYSLFYLLSQPWLRKKDRMRIHYCFHRQMDLFEETFHRAPDFIDGHEHVHIFPAIRNLFIRECEKRFHHHSRKPWIRQVSHPLESSGAKLKSIILNALNIGFVQLCKKHGFATNKKFAGVYSLKPSANYSELFKNWMEKCGDDTLIMCHPSKTNESADLLMQARANEYQVILSYIPNT